MFPWKTKPCHTPNFKNHGPYISIFYGVLSDLLLLLVVSTLHCEIYRSILSIVIVMVVALLLSKENCNPGRSQDSLVPGWPREWNKKVVEFPMPLPQLTVHCHCHCHCQKSSQLSVTMDDGTLIHQPIVMTHKRCQPKKPSKCLIALIICINASFYNWSYSYIENVGGVSVYSSNRGLTRLDQQRLWTLGWEGKIDTILVVRIDFSQDYWSHSSA